MENTWSYLPKEQTQRLYNDLTFRLYKQRIVPIILTLVSQASDGHIPRYSPLD